MRHTATEIALLVTLMVLPLLATGQYLSTQEEGVLRLGHYSAVDGTLGLVLDRTGDQPLARFDGKTEVLALTVETQPRKATLLKRDNGFLFARVERWGRMYLHLPNTRDPLVILRDADARSIKLVGLTQEKAEAAVRTANAAVKTATQRSIVFQVEWKAFTTAEDRAVVVQAVENAALGLAAVGSDELGRDALKSVSKTITVSRGTPQLARKGKQLRLQVAPQKSFWGRISSLQIAARLEDIL